MSIGAVEHIERLNKIYADCPDDGLKTGERTRRGYTYADRELLARVGPMEYHQAMTALDAMPKTYNDFSRERLRVQLRMLGEGTRELHFGRDGSPFVQFITDRPADELRVIFQDAESVSVADIEGGWRACHVYWG
jgi:hypothetical protein